MHDESVEARGHPHVVRDFRFSVEQDGEVTRAVFEFRPRQDDPRLGRVFDYLYRASAALPSEAVPHAR